MSLTIYSKNSCPNCEKAVGMLELANIPYTVIKVDEDEMAYQFLIKEGHRAVPQIYDNETAIKGGLSGLATYIKGAVNAS